MGSEKENKLIADAIFKKTMGLSISIASKSKDESNEIAAYLLDNINGYDFTDTNLSKSKVCNNLIQAAVNLASDDCFVSVGNCDTLCKAYFKLAQLQVIEFKELQVRKDYDGVLDSLRHICRTLEKSSPIRRDSKISKPSDYYNHPGLIDAGLPEDVLKPILMAKLVTLLKDVGVSSEAIISFVENQV